MKAGGRGDENGIDGFVIKEGVEVVVDFYAGCACGGGAGRGGVGDGGDIGSGGVGDTGGVLGADAAVTHDADSDRRRHGCTSLRMRSMAAPAAWARSAS